MQMFHQMLVLNGGSYTEKSLQVGIGDIPVSTVQSKNISIVLHEGTVSLLHKNTIIPTENTLLYNRFERDLQMVGLISECFTVPSSKIINPIVLSYKDAGAKTAQMIRSVLNDIKIPNTIITQKEGFLENEKSILSKIQFPLIVKTDGNQGMHVSKLSSEDNLRLHISRYPDATVCMLQEFIPNTFDIRLIVAFGNYIGAIKRTAKEGMFLNNVSQGGSVDIYRPTETEIDIAFKAAQVNRTDIAGVDLIHKDSEALFLELNQGFGVKGYESIHTDCPIMQKIAYIIKKKYCS